VFSSAASNNFGNQRPEKESGSVVRTNIYFSWADVHWWLLAVGEPVLLASQGRGSQRKNKGNVQTICQRADVKHISPPTRATCNAETVCMRVRVCVCVCVCVCVRARVCVCVWGSRASSMLALEPVFTSQLISYSRPKMTSTQPELMRAFGLKRPATLLISCRCGPLPSVFISSRYALYSVF
jgi:hypothetical protein